MRQKYGDGAPISVYAEVEQDAVTVFVKDRGQASTKMRYQTTGSASSTRLSGACSGMAVGQR
jgi:hypothetical protein